MLLEVILPVAAGAIAGFVSYKIVDAKRVQAEKLLEKANAVEQELYEEAYRIQAHGESIVEETECRANGTEPKVVHIVQEPEYQTDMMVQEIHAYSKWRSAKKRCNRIEYIMSLVKKDRKIIPICMTVFFTILAGILSALYRVDIGHLERGEEGIAWL